MEGLNAVGRFWQFQTLGYDDVGGVTGAYVTVLEGTRVRISARRVSQQSIETGLEVPRLFDMIANGQDFSAIFERDEFELTSPSDSPYINERFRIIAIQHDSRVPSIGHTEFTLSRIEKSRSRQ